jgi:hypothetical protein
MRCLIPGRVGLPQTETPRNTMTPKERLKDLRQRWKAALDIEVTVTYDDLADDKPILVTVGGDVPARFRGRSLAADYLEGLLAGALWYAKWQQSQKAAQPTRVKSGLTKELGGV